MKIINSITYTQYDSAIRVGRESTIQLTRSIKLSERGAHNILHKLGYTDAIVTRIETMIDER